MKTERNTSVIAIDIAGGALAAMLLLTAAWLVVVRYPQASASMEELDRSIASAERDRAGLVATKRQQVETVRARSAHLAERGLLPDLPPIEEYLQLLTRLAHQHQLSVVGHSPSAPRNYPGLLEQRYAYEVTGSSMDIIRFLSAIERQEQWCDVSHLVIDASRTKPGDKPATTSAALTISLFSSPPAAQNRG